MARPKKIDTEQLVRLVDSYFTTEAAGDSSKLKCSMLEVFANRNGIEVKAYDFRRNQKVRNRIEELKQLVLDENGMQMLQGDAYKSLDVTMILKARRDSDELRSVLGELDDYWKKVYDRSVQISEKNIEFQRIITKLRSEKTELEHNFRDMKEGMGETITADNKLKVENRYLRKMLKTYLYPSLANEILVEENLLKNPDTEVTDTAKDNLIDSKFPTAFREAVSEDAKSIRKEEELLGRMWEEMNNL